MENSLSNKYNITFFSKNIITCPACNTEFQKEELQTGRGRINAGELTEELRRKYIPTQKFGIVNPLIYPILVCPECYLAGLPNDFQKIPEKNIANVHAEKENRRQLIRQTFGKELDFRENRDTIEGLASYILGFACTIFLPPEASPTAKRGLYGYRGAWLADDIYQQSKIEHFKELREALYQQAYVNYDRCLELQIKNKEPFDGFVWMGPDVDTNFGYDGLLYTIAYLALKQLPTFSPEEQLIKLGNIKRVLSKIFGVGKSTKNKPAILVTNAKNLYAEANHFIDKLANKGLDTNICDMIENEEEIDN